MGNVILRRRPKGKRTPAKEVKPIAPQHPTELSHQQPPKIKTFQIKLPKKQVISVTNVTLVLVNFKTEKLTREAISTFRNYYPDTPAILVDNCSRDESTQLIKRQAKKPHTEAILNEQNIGHGPAMHRAIVQVMTPYVFTLDSDCIVHQPGFLEAMLREFDDRNLYAIGWRRFVDRRTGVPLEWHAQERPPKKFIAYIHPAAAMYQVRKYRQLRPFFHHGAPCLNNMVDANKRGFGLQSFRIFDYIEHLEAGTRRMYGGRWNPKTQEAPSQWRKGQHYPI